MTLAKSVAVPADRRRAELRLLALLRRYDAEGFVRGPDGKPLANFSLWCAAGEALKRFDARFGGAKK